MKYPLLVLLWLLSLPALAVDVAVVGLFSGRAVLEIDGARRVLKVGDISPEGVKLLAADSESALLEIDGREQRMALGGHISGSYQAPPRAEVHVWPDTRGMYRMPGSINGQTVDFLVDTGATHIAMNARQARRLGIDYRVRGERDMASTASDVVPVFRVTLDRVQLGGITLRQVTAVVFEGTQPSDVLLGQSFLNRLEMRRENEAMVLREKY
jgi:aspartyl protease family protein